MKKTTEHNKIDTAGEQIISIAPMECTKGSDEKRKALLELQLQMATSSINHEYARIEFEDIDSIERKEELLDYMSECRTQYLKARENLERYDPWAVIEFEKDLMRQKSTTLAHYNA